MNQNNIVPILFVCFVIWRIVSRIRRNIGPQRIRPGLMIFRIAVFAIVTVLLAQVAPHQNTLVALGSGLLGGCLLGFVGVHLTRFESTEKGHFFVPNIYIGMAISVVFLARIAFQLSRVQALTQQSFDPNSARSPMTYFLFAMVAGYYITFYAGIIIRGRHLGPPPTHG